MRYHIEKHAPFGKRAAAHLGMLKYIGRYPDQAFSLEGKVLPELPWDRIVVEWFSDEFWKGMEAWRKSPEGLEMTKDEERFIDRNSAVALECQVHAYIP